MDTGHGFDDNYGFDESLNFMYFKYLIDYKDE